MKESKFFKNAAAERHEHHETGAPVTPSKDDHAHKSTPHEDKKRNHHKEQNFPKERGETKMKIKTAPIVNVLALAVLFVVGFAADNQAKTDEFKFVDEKAINVKADKLKAFGFQPSAFNAPKFGAFNPYTFAVKVSDFKADYFEKADSNAVAFKNFNPKDVDFKAVEFKGFNFKANEFKKANFMANDFEKVEFKA